MVKSGNERLNACTKRDATALVTASIAEDRRRPEGEMASFVRPIEEAT